MVVGRKERQEKPHTETCLAESVPSARPRYVVRPTCASRGGIAPQSLSQSVLGFHANMPMLVCRQKVVGPLLDPGHGILRDGFDRFGPQKQLLIVGIVLLPAIVLQCHFHGERFSEAC